MIIFFFFFFFSMSALVFLVDVDDLLEMRNEINVLLIALVVGLHQLVFYTVYGGLP